MTASLQMTSRESRRLARFLGWFSIGLGAVELLAPHRLTRALGMAGQEPWLQHCGAREIADGVAILTTESAASVWNRVGGDALDAGNLALHLDDDNPKKANVALALVAVGAVAVLDWACADALESNERQAASGQGCNLDEIEAPAVRTLAVTAGTVAPPQPLTALVFAGGLGLAAYHGGAYQAFAARGLSAQWVAGSSAGAVTAALIAGNVPDARETRLREFWALGQDTPRLHPFAYLEGWISAITAHVVGDPALFHLRLPWSYPFRSLYDFEPMRRRMARLIDFDRLNGGEMRVSIAATDICTGDPVIFDSARERIGLDHLLASCGFVPEFAPVTIGSLTMVDGGLSLNAPFDPILQGGNRSAPAFRNGSVCARRRIAD